jgi:hypothetical protein|tara:strand:- start:531 stop:632 length:102 start_codon:yes stop_codon:yes gene_type:complete
VNYRGSWAKKKAAEQGHEYAKEWLEKNAKEKNE